MNKYPELLTVQEAVNYKMEQGFHLTKAAVYYNRADFDWHKMRIINNDKFRTWIPKNQTRKK